LSDVAEWIRTTTNGALEIDDGALYTSLHRMEKRGWLDQEWRVSPQGRRAKYYQLTRVGRDKLRAGERDWHGFATAVFNVFEARQRAFEQTTARECVFGVSSSTPSRYGVRGVAGFDSASPVLPMMTTEMTAGSVALAFADVVWTEPSGSKNVWPAVSALAGSPFIAHKMLPFTT
jgi:hypothetical protein